MVYEAFREDGGPTLYDSRKTPVTADVLFAGFVFAAAILGFSLIFVLFGFRGKRIVWNGIFMFGELLILTSIILCNFGQDWEVARLSNVTVQYKAGISEEIQADIGVSIGLRSVNITLKTDPTQVQFKNGTMNETINYNERFSWDNRGFTQGLAGFGPNAGLVNREFREAQWKGVPYPILWVAEYFTIDGEGIRWGRFYRQAGYYAYICVWLAFPLWIFAVLLYKLVLRYGGYFSMLTGLSLGTANILYYFIRNPTDLAIHFSSDHVLVFEWGWCFWINLATACLTFAIGVIVLILDAACYNKLASWCGVDPLADTVELNTDFTHWRPEVTTHSDKSSTKVIAVKPANSDNLDMSAKPKNPRCGSARQFVRHNTLFGGFKSEKTLLNFKADDNVTVYSGESSCSTSITSLNSSGYEGSLPGSASSTKSKLSKRSQRKVSPVSS